MATDRVFDTYRRTLTGATLLMIGLSWPLWIDDPNFPRVPFLANCPVFPSIISWIVLAGIGGTLALATVGRAWRLATCLSWVLLFFSIVQDQNRLQAWIYQYLVITIFLLGVSHRRALVMARWSMIALYGYSGLSKLDASFCRELGPTFLEAGLRPFGLTADHWPESIRTSAVLAMPGFELVVAVLLASERTRRLGLVSSILMHGALVMVLGPWNLGQSTIVLVWNLAQIAENLWLFGPSQIDDTSEPERWHAWPTRLIFWVAMILPLGERWGFCDAWPGHALYASHVERAEVSVHEDDVDRLPDSIRRRLVRADASPWRRVDLTGWSRDVRGTPLYPSGRVGNAIAEFFETRFGGSQPIRLIQWGQASFWTDKRERDECLGLKAIRRRADRFPINAHPSG